MRRTAMQIFPAHNIVPITAFRWRVKHAPQRKGSIAMTVVLNAFLMLAMALIVWHGGVAVAQVAESSNAPIIGAPQPTSDTLNTEKVLRGLRDKDRQVRDTTLDDLRSAALGQEIIPHLKSRGPEAQKNREVLERLLEECRRTEKEIVEALNPVSGTAAPPTNAPR